MENKKRSTIITIVILALMFLGSTVYFILNYTKDENSLTVIEKKWITDNLNNVIDVNIYNDIPVFGFNGNGIIFDFLEFFTKETDIKFNKISYYTTSEFNKNNISFQVLNSKEALTNEDILLYKDHYVILSNKITSSISLEDNFTLGVLTSDLEILKNYFNSNITLKEYTDVNTLITAITNEEVNYILLPNLSYMDDILTNNLNIVYHVEDLKKSFVLRVTDPTTYSILKKTYNKYLDTYYKENYQINYLNVFFNSTNTSDLLQKNYNAKTYKYGYTINMPYENKVNNEFVGTILNYINLYEEYTGAEIEPIMYQTIDDLKSALVNGDIDFALGNFNYSNFNLDYKLTSSLSDTNYVVLSKNNYNINSLKGLQKEKVSVVSSSVLHYELINNGVEAKMYANTDDLIRNMDDYSIVIMDKETYTYYQDSKIKEYKIIYEGTIKDGYKFILNSGNEPFNSLFSYFVSSLNYQNIKYNYNTNITLNKDYTSIKLLALIVSLLLVLVISIILINKKSVAKTIISKDDKLKYIDPMTSLKNRNYLNLNIYKWDDNVIFPQSVVVLDINRLREINDTYGREVGDEIIKKVASTLINNQIENTDIIRSGGDEFLIYMVGYEEKQVLEYTKKLVKDMKDIPNSLGIEVGYSMILDEVKTVDDAINEAISMMTKTKEKKRAKEQEEK